MTTHDHLRPSESREGYGYLAMDWLSIKITEWSAVLANTSFGWFIVLQLGAVDSSQAARLGLVPTQKTRLLRPATGPGKWCDR